MRLLGEDWKSDHEFDRKLENSVELAFKRARLILKFEIFDFPRKEVITTSEFKFLRPHSGSDPESSSTTVVADKIFMFPTDYSIFGQSLIWSLL